MTSTTPRYGLQDNAFSIQYWHHMGSYDMTRTHYHPYYEIYYLLSGERLYSINGIVYTVRKGDMIIINPQDVHQTSSTDASEFQRIVIYFSHEFVQPHLPAPGLLPFAHGSRLLRFPAEEQVYNERLVREMLEECKKAQEGHEVYVRALLMQLLIRIYRVHLHPMHEAGQFIDPMHRRISEIASYLNEHFHENVSLTEIASRFYISPAYLSRTFKKFTGLQFREYLQILRIKEAQKQLRESRDKIQHIAENSGFGHIAHFNKTFKKIVRLSPRQYRKRSRRVDP